ncbi:gamma-glutamyl-gamma-aminobutyrate hydrolase family protein [Stappia sp. ES.058]|uniref:gamma-glutamyl-gamma-aminobutyrate hydrolase family protein n=1 Tax=Stappia sp. ES.058 TaxID=1881061 RepID=UPI001AD94701|nr:gamma-glutamyl-gamma-aminobutyrate hydrolase family protein [Stappia sp. ES.058]
MVDLSARSVQGQRAPPPVGKGPRPGLRISARDEFGIMQAIEAVSGPPLLGVQWHPELMPFSPRGQDLFAWFVKQAA